MASRGRGAAQRGARFERAVVGWLRDQWGLRAERIRSGRSTDAGDIAWPDSDWLLDCKSQDRWSVLRWFADAEFEAAVESEATGKRVRPVLVIDRPGTSDTGAALVVVALRDAGELLR